MHPARTPAPNHRGSSPPAPHAVLGRAQVMSLGLEDRLSIVRTGIRGWLVVRQYLTRRIYGEAFAGLVISFGT